jgi:hypothetical protein
MLEFKLLDHTLKKCYRSQLSGTIATTKILFVNLESLQEEPLVIHQKL